MKKYIARFLLLILGLAIMSFGSALSDAAGLGMAPWDVLNDGFSNLMDKAFHYFIADGALADSLSARFATIGRASIFLGLIILVADVVMHEKVGFGTIINILIVGLIWDACMRILPDYSALPMSENFIIRLLMCAFSTIPGSFGMYLYIHSALGAGPRDTLMVAVTKRAKKLSVGMIRVIIEGSALVCGILLGGKVGLGTVILVLADGPVMELIFRLLHFDVKTVKNENIAETIKNLKNT